MKLFATSIYFSVHRPSRGRRDFVRHFAVLAETEYQAISRSVFVLAQGEFSDCADTIRLGDSLPIPHHTKSTAQAQPLGVISIA